MLKAQPLCTGAELNLRDRTLGEVEKDSFIALLPGEGGKQVLILIIYVSTREDVMRNFITMVQRCSC